MIKQFFSEKNTQIIIAMLLVMLAIWSRFVPHPANFTALTAVALFGGAVLPRKLSLLVPLSAMIISDLVIGLHSLSLVVWLSFVAVIFVGQVLSTKLSATRVALASLTGSSLFFVVTNFAVWAEGRMYAMSLEGLAQCYANALPFFRNMLVGDMVYVVMLFGAYALAVQAAGIVRRHKKVFLAR